MNYLPWSILALVAYSAVPPLMKVATREIPSDVAALISNTVLVVVTLAVVTVAGESVPAYLTHRKAPYVYAAGLFLAVGILAYYRALALGPVSVVAPIFGMFLVTSAVLGIALLDEPLTARKAAGIVLAGVAVYLTAGG